MLLTFWRSILARCRRSSSPRSWYALGSNMAPAPSNNEMNPTKGVQGSGRFAPAASPMCPSRVISVLDGHRVGTPAW